MTLAQWNQQTIYAIADQVYFTNHGYTSLQNSNLNKNPISATTFWVQNPSGTGIGSVSSANANIVAITDISKNVLLTLSPSLYLVTQSTAPAEISLGNNAGQYFRQYLSNTNGGGLIAGHMQLFGYDNNSSSILQIYDINAFNGSFRIFNNCTIDNLAVTTLNGQPAPGSLVYSSVILLTSFANNAIFRTPAIWTVISGTYSINVEIVLASTATPLQCTNPSDSLNLNIYNGYGGGSSTPLHYIYNNMSAVVAAPIILQYSFTQIFSGVNQLLQIMLAINNTSGLLTFDTGGSNMQVKIYSI